MLRYPSQKIMKNYLHTIRHTFLFIFAILGVIGCMVLAVSFGAKDVSFNTVWTAIFHYNSILTEQQIIYELRLPRVIGAAVVGAAFSVAGSLLQGVTRNPLADAGILGINAGAMFIVTLSFAFFPSISYSLLMFFSFIGAVLSTLFIFIIGSSVPDGLTPMRLTISGAVIAALLHSLSTGIAIYFDLSQDLAFWRCGRSKVESFEGTSSRYSDHYCLGNNPGMLYFSYFFRRRHCNESWHESNSNKSTFYHRGGYFGRGWKLLLFEHSFVVFVFFICFFTFCQHFVVDKTNTTESFSKKYFLIFIWQ
jgi:hypothetical protein